MTTAINPQDLVTSTTALPEVFRNVSPSIDQITPLPPLPPPDNPEVLPEPITALEVALGDYLLMEDPDALAVLLGTVAAFRLNLDLVWLLIVGPPSGAKTELVTLIADIPEYFELGDLTEKTLMSGWEGEVGDRKPAQENSLLEKLKGKIVAFKDFTTILSLKSDRRNEILSQLREVYDGKYAKAWGTGKHLRWEGRVGLIAGVTEAIDREYKAMAQLGPRFVLFRLQQPDRNAVALRAMENSQDGAEDTRPALVRRIARFVERLDTKAPPATRPQMKRLAVAADLVTRGRSAVVRDGDTRKAEHVPTPEVPGRFSKQLLALTRGIAAVRGHDAVTDRDVNTACRVSLDAIPPQRRILLDELAESNTALRLSDLQERVHGASSAAIQRTVQDLISLGAIEQSGYELTVPARFVPVLTEARHKGTAELEAVQ